MLSQYDIDYLMQKIQSGESAYVYYVAHLIEGRENLPDEHNYKSVSRFKVVKVEVEDIENAYFEYLNYLQYPGMYHKEEEEFYYDPTTKYMQVFIVPNEGDSYDKDINARMPAMIYGYIRKIWNRDVLTEVNNPSPIKVVYTNVLEVGDNVYNTIQNSITWKYQKLRNPEIVDGIEYKYITSDWYILNLKNYPMVEKPLINTKSHSAYFLDIQDAFRYLEQLIA